jgi:DNA invertase Pin-like site-specific DNA recombinase
MAKRSDIETFRKACIAKGGIISGIAASLGVSRESIRKWCEKYPAYSEALADSREHFLDLAETNLQTLCKGIPKIEKNEHGEKVFAGWEVPPSESAIVFTMRTLGKRRGYTERTETDITSGGKPILPRVLSKEEIREYLADFNKEY